MTTKPTSKTQSYAFSKDELANRPVQTGALPGGQPGQGVNTSSSAAGQSNVDAAFEQGTEPGKDNLRPR